MPPFNTEDDLAQMDIRVGRRFLTGIAPELMRQGDDATWHCRWRIYNTTEDAVKGRGPSTGAVLRLVRRPEKGGMSEGDNKDSFTVYDEYEKRFNKTKTTQAS
ncbi:hypothetical protein THARTR1_03770 [Trichoderma harzianum]|uniref:Uncharacterized protein n=1 Tax=Trichoderma harzianum TaxID=5544 RepID=A0A2K0UEP1_TRIHA|nr:hypothetical protein THARTR1_03770 [Trichoderma harzianum]